MRPPVNSRMLSEISEDRKACTMQKEDHRVSHVRILGHGIDSVPLT
jgi:hypothetical protein